MSKPNQLNSKQFKGAGASVVGGQTKEGALGKRYFQTSEIAQNRTKSPFTSANSY